MFFQTLEPIMMQVEAVSVGMYDTVGYDANGILLFATLVSKPSSQAVTVSVKQRCFSMDSSLRSGHFVCVSSGFMPETTGNLQISLNFLCIQTLKSANSIKVCGFSQNPQISHGFHQPKIDEFQACQAFSRKTNNVMVTV